MASWPDPRATVAVITHERRTEISRTVAKLAELPERPAVVVVDNASRDGTAEIVRRDLAALGWWLCYIAGVVVHHAPSAARESTARRRDGIRNTLWTTWLRRPAPSALRRTVWLARTVPRDTASLAAFGRALLGLP